MRSPNKIGINSLLLNMADMLLFYYESATISDTEVGRHRQALEYF